MYNNTSTKQLRLFFVTSIETLCGFKQIWIVLSPSWIQDSDTRKRQKMKSLLSSISQEFKVL